MAKIEITICTGTTCYVMGAGNLLLLGESLSDEQAQHVAIKGASCLGLCKEGHYGKAPFVMVEDTLFAEATPDLIQAELQRRLDMKGRG